MSNTFDRQALVEAYIDRLLDNMSTKDLLRIVGDQLEENLSSYSDEELISEVEEYYPELIAQWNTKLSSSIWKTKDVHCIAHLANITSTFILRSIETL